VTSVAWRSTDHPEVESWRSTLDDAQFRRLFWVIGNNLRDPVMQNARGESATAWLNIRPAELAVLRPGIRGPAATIEVG